MNRFEEWIFNRILRKETKVGNREKANVTEIFAKIRDAIELNAYGNIDEFVIDCLTNSLRLRGGVPPDYTDEQEDNIVKAIEELKNNLVAVEIMGMTADGKLVRKTKLDDTKAEHVYCSARFCPYRSK